MGKAGRRKKNRQRRKQQSVDPIATATATATANGDDDSTNIVNPHSAVQQLRHADPKIRHAALVALQASVMSQLHCSSRPVSMKVLQAVREQVTSNDLECSAVAADCLAQYLSATSSSSSSKDENNKTEEQKQTTASWALVLLGRLDDCRKALAEQQQQQQSQAEDSSSNNKSKNYYQQKKREKIKKQWYAVSAPCFIALCQLIEDNGNALDQINLQKKTFVEVVFGMLSLETMDTTTTTTTKTAPTENDDTAMTDDNTATTTATAAEHDAIFTALRNSTALYAARCLHSALDDNWELAEVLQHGDNKDAWKALLGGRPNMVSNGGGNSGSRLSTLTRLHLIGCLVNLYQLSLLSSDDSNASSSWQEELVLEYGITTATAPASSSPGLLLETLLSMGDDAVATTTCTKLEETLRNCEIRYRNAVILQETQQRDQQLEEEIDAQVKERNEPAISIARRQKKVKEAKREKFREQQKAKMIADAASGEVDDDDMDMMDMDVGGGSDDKDDDEDKTTSGKFMNREEDGEQAVNEAMLSYTETTGQLQLALEILTNLISTWISEEGGSGDDNDMGMTDATKSNKLRNVILRHETGSKLTNMLQTLCRFLRSGKKTEEDGDKCAYEVDDPIRTDIEETNGKISACVINCVLSGIIVSDSSDGNGNAGAKSVWNKIVQDLEIESNNISIINTTPNNAVVDAYASLLVVLMETNPRILYEEKYANAFEKNIATFQRMLPRRDAVCLLSTTVLAMVSSPTTTTASAEIFVRTITEDFLRLLATRVDDGNSNSKKDDAAAEVNAIVVNTQTQILQTFMDWYGTDTFYPQLYNELKVSTAITSCLASISNAMNNNTNSSSVIDLDEEQTEILSNSERFVEYKKQQ